jgi:HlyD family secretion protein
MRKFVIGAAVLVLALLALVYFRVTGRDAGPKYVTAALERGTIAITVSATGALEAVTTVQVGSQVSGTISALYADFNDKVEKGQVLAQLDPTFLKAQVAQAQADLDRERASTGLAKREYERALTLFEEKIVSEAERDAVLTQYELAKTRDKSAEANLDRVKTNLDYATIVSPIDGVVISRDVDVGQTVAASLQAPTLFTIAEDLKRMQVKASIDEADIGKVAEGQTVQFTVDAYPDKLFAGRVKQIRLAPQIVQNVVSYDVIIEVANPDLLLKPGMTANVTILVDRREDVLKAPAAALRFRPAGDERSGRARKPDGAAAAGEEDRASASSERRDGPRAGTAHGPTIWILGDAGEPRPVRVEVGISDGMFTQIVSNQLEEGDSVIVSATGTAASPANQQVNPFAPRFPGRRR